MDIKWKFVVGPRELKNVSFLSEEKQRRSEGNKCFCSACKAEIMLEPASTFGHQGWRFPLVKCGAYLIRQIEVQSQIEVLYVCQKCYQKIEFAEHLAIEKKYRIPRP